MVAEGSYYTQRQPHLPIEPDVGYGYINDKGQVVIHSKSVAIYLHALMIAPGLGLEFPRSGCGAKHHRRHLWLQVQPHHGSPCGRGR